MDEIEVITKDDSIFVEKESGTSVNYFLFNEYEIHLNKIKPHSIQEWHKHNNIEEVLVVTSGEIVVWWMESDEKRFRVIEKGTVVRVKKSIHTLENRSNNISEFIVYRMILKGENNRDKIKNHKIVITKGQD